EEALEAIDFDVPETYRTEYQQAENKTVELVGCSAFATNLLDFNQPVVKELTSLDSFIIYLCVEGSCQVKCDEHKETMTRGEVILIPAIQEKLVLQPTPACKLLEIYDV
ncbi:MAG: mannose-6-phosphate isomerase, partial [Bacteroidia bacterium]|nr:mannose-6-phosphate isomerase [Bacteroidia bacterium]